MNLFFFNSNLDLKSVWVLNIVNINFFFSRYNFKVSDEDIKSIISDFGGDLTIPENFVQTGSVYAASGFNNYHTNEILINDQTTLLCDMLGITNPNKVIKNSKDNFKDFQQVDKESGSEKSEASLDEEEFREIVCTQQNTVTLPSAENSQENSDENVSSFDSSNSSKRSLLDSNDLNSTSKKLKRRNLSIYSDDFS